MSILHRKIVESPKIPSVERTASNLISKAYQTNRPRSFHGEDPGGLSSGNFYNGCIQMYDDLQCWQMPIFHRAMHEMERNEKDMDTDG